MDCSVKKYLGPQKIGNATVENIKESGIVELSVTVVVLKLRESQLEEIALGILHLLYPLFIFGTSDLFQTQYLILGSLLLLIAHHILYRKNLGSKLQIFQNIQSAQAV